MTSTPMTSTAEELEDNKVKLSITVDSVTFEADVDAAFKRIAQEVRLPGFRPGKAPRRVLEARLGPDAARQDALREALPRYYARAVGQHEVDAIGPPDIDITAGEEAGDVSFEAVVEVRPVITVPGYEGLKVTVPSPFAPEEEIDGHIERMRELDATLETVSRPATEGDHAIVNIVGTLDGEQQDGLTADDYAVEIGRGMITPEVDEELTGAKAGDILEFNATHPDPEETRNLRFRILVKEIQTPVLPELTDEWVADNTDDSTIEELRAGLADRIERVRRAQGGSIMRERLGDALAELVTDEVPEAMVSLELQNRLQELSINLASQGMNVPQYLQMTGRSEEELIDEMRQGAATAARVDLALRAVATAEGIECTDDDLDEEIAHAAMHLGQSPEEVRAQFEGNDQLPAVRSDVRKRKALEWLLEKVEIVDEDGNPVDPDAFDAPHDHSDEHDDGDHESDPDDEVSE